MAKVTITLEDRDDDGSVAVTTVYDPPLGDTGILTDAQSTAQWLLQDAANGDSFMEELSKGRISGVCTC